MKKVIAILLSVLMLFSLVACVPGNKDSELKKILVEKDWVMYTMGASGIEIDYATMTSFGYGGSAKFTDADTFTIELNVETTETQSGLYTCNDEDMTVSMKLDGEQQTAYYKDGILSVTLESEGEEVSMSFVQEDSELLTDAPSNATVDTAYNGDLNGTVWSLYTVESEGVVMSEDLFAQLGYTGSIEFVDDANFVMDLFGENVTGEYTVDGDTVSLMGVLAMERDNGLLTIDIDGTICTFGYDTELN